MFRNVTGDQTALHNQQETERATAPVPLRALSRPTQLQASAKDEAFTASDQLTSSPQ